MTTEAVFIRDDDQIWVTDGTISGTKEIYTANLYIQASLIASYGNEVLFGGDVPDSASSLDEVYDVVTCNGTSAGTVFVVPPTSITDYARYDLTSIAPIGTRLIAVSDIYNSLVVTNGTQAGTSTLLFATVPSPFTWGIELSLYSLGTKCLRGEQHAIKL